MTTEGLEARAAWASGRQANRCKDREEWDAQFRGLLGDRVTQLPTPALAVRVNPVGGFGAVTLTLPVADVIHPRIDTVCQRGNLVTVIRGIPAARPEPPRIPPGYSPLANVTVPANATSIVKPNIEGTKHEQ